MPRGRALGRARVMKRTMKPMKHTGKIALLVAFAGIIAVALILLGGRLGIWEPIVGFGFYRNYFNPLAFIIAGLGLFALIIYAKRKQKGGMLAGAVVTFIGVACLGPLVAGTLNPTPRGPPIHDISTDTTNPPLFEVLDETRAGATNTLEYGGPEIAAAQAAGYPDIAPLETDLSADAAFERALTVANDMGWEVVGSDAERHRFEAVARTSVFYFADDVVVVVSAQGEGSRVDMRGVSRVGRSDQGVNAARIREFQQLFAQ